MLKRRRNMCKVFGKIIGVVVALWAFEVQADVNVAIIAPRAGHLQKFGEELIGGAQIAVNEINANGGIKGEKVNLVVVDDQCDDRFAVSTAQMMSISQSYKMDVVIGPYCSNAFDKVSDIYANAKIFQIIPTATVASNPQKKYNGLVKMVGSVSAQGHDFYQYYHNNFDGKYVALVYDTDIRNVVEIAASVQKEFKEGGVATLLKSYHFNQYPNNYGTLAEDIVNAGNDIVYVLGKAEPIAQLSRELKDLNREVVIFTNRYQSEGNYQELMGDLAEGSYFLALPSLKDNPSFTETLVQLRLNGQEPRGLGVYSYSAVRLWEDLVKKANSLKYDDLSDTLNKNQLKTTFGEVTYVNGNPEKSINYSIYKLQNGEYTQVY